ncbi:uncharacterized protein A1O9_03994 [Exophiala aquamarina CBS 119918]|uniref:Chromosome segregation in meiosis protein n=1 Tax=Exophiala aquamarina CBS 119918 TaxID=1182545 RepID=A0A072PUE2_9EURO|nr:uncharacterized protein A1O9_03994 [Exophiala aquamarina CBS 119918]KEF59150.1 hypothetical protein A1O9_03994 [Exophiala aquamarina CBS 119918]
MAADPLTAATADDLFNYDTTDDEDPFGDKTTKVTRDDKANLSPRYTKRKADDGDDELGIDEEVQIKKKRKPIAKLDEARLLSAPGIPNLRELARSGKISKKLRLKGKGHEFSDAARLLNYYQQWLDNLYPRAKFADGLQLIEKVGHSKRMNVMRKEWIDESKPGYVSKKSLAGKDEFEDDDLYGAGDPATTENQLEQTSDAAPNASPGVGMANNSLFVSDLNTNRYSTANDELPEDDELEALLAEQDARQAPSKAQTTTNIDSEGEDDLDALLAEQETRRVQAPTSSHNRNEQPRPTPHAPFDDNDEDELDALLAEQEAEVRPRSPLAQIQSLQSGPAAPKRTGGIFEDDDLDNLDALLAEQDVRQTQQTVPRPSTGTTVSLPYTIGRDNACEASHENIEAQVDQPLAENNDGLPFLQTASELMAKEAQEAEGEDFEAEGMFSSSPAPQEE